MELQEDTKARLLSVDDVQEGESWRDDVEMTDELVQGFIGLTNDRALGHVDPKYAAKMGFERCIVHGFLVNSGYSRILGMFLPGSNTVIHKIQIDMLAPVYIGDTITYEVQVKRVIAAVKSVQLDLLAMNQNGDQVSKGMTICVFRI